MPFRRVKLVVDMSVRRLCQKPYYNHLRGCPNYNKKKGCPPRTPCISRVFDLTQSVYVIWNRFYFHQHCRRMRYNHPGWSKHQVRCCLYWQGKARKHLKKEIESFSYYHPEHRVIYPPEAYGVNVTATMLSIGIELEWPPVKFTYQVAIAGERR